MAFFLNESQESWEKGTDSMQNINSGLINGILRNKTNIACTEARS